MREDTRGTFFSVPFFFFFVATLFIQPLDITNSCVATAACERRFL